MAAVAPAADQATDLIQKLSLEPKANGTDGPDAVKKVGSVNNSDVPNALVPPYERSITPLLQEYMDGGMCYMPNGYPSTTYYYTGYEGSINEWEDYSRYLNTDGVEMQPPGVYGDIYHGYGYASYGPYPSPGSPVPTLGHDGQLYGPQHYQFPASYYQPPAPTNAPPQNAKPIPNSKDVPTSTGSEQQPISTETVKSSSYGTAKGNTNGNNGSAKTKPSLQNSSFHSNGTFTRGVSGYEDPRYGFDGMWSPFPWFDGSMYSDGQQRPVTTTNLPSAPHANNTTRNQNNHSLPHLMSTPNQRSSSGMGTAAPGVINRIYPNNRIYSQNTSAFRNGFGFGSNFYDSRANGRWGGLVDNKYKNRGRNNGFYFGNEKLDGLTELNRGPRADRLRNPKVLGQTNTQTLKGQSVPTAVNVQNSTPSNKDEYNKADFPDTYSDAKFFIIKSYSEDDIHKSVKYNVWASTPNGNKKLDSAYQEAQEKTSACPVFLFFSVNTSGQFVGVAEMTGPVDFNKTVEYWQQDKWTGCFPLKWHIVKDVPNNTLKHITLEYNDNKPVTNSRDTQEVKLDQGLQMLKIFKEHSSKTSILDDFDFYESRQTIMQEKRAKQQLQKKIMDLQSDSADVKDKDGLNCKDRLESPAAVVTLLKKEHGENGVAATATISLKDAKTSTEKRVVANGVSNGL